MSKIFSKPNRQNILAVLVFTIFIISIFQFGSIIVNNKTNENNSNGPVNSQNSVLNKLQTNYDNPIIIDGNNNFTTTASNKGWTGNGSVSNPFIIENLNLTFQTNNKFGFLIENTNLQFILKYNSLSYPSTAGSSSNLLTLINVTNALVSSNRLNGNTGDIDLYVINSMNTTITNNTISHGGIGIFIDGCPNTTIMNNKIESTYLNAMDLASSENLVVKDNILNSNKGGIDVTYLNGIKINNNVINHTTLAVAMYVWGVANGTITNNSISYSTNNCLYLALSNYTTFQNNNLYDCRGTADVEFYNSSHNSIIGNTFNNSFWYGINFRNFESKYNNFTGNYFADSNPVNFASMSLTNTFKDNYYYIGSKFVSLNNNDYVNVSNYGIYYNGSYFIFWFEITTSSNTSVNGISIMFNFSNASKNFVNVLNYDGTEWFYAYKQINSTFFNDLNSVTITIEENVSVNNGFVPITLTKTFSNLQIQDYSSNIIANKSSPSFEIFAILSVLVVAFLKRRRLRK